MVVFMRNWLFFLPVVITLMIPTATSSATSRNLMSHDDHIPGFISIDCGLPKDSEAYTDNETEIVYTSDAGYIDTGESKNIKQSSNLNPKWKLLQTVRSFPSGQKNCYTLKPDQGKGINYLVRATFMYGNYDNINSLPKFDLYLGPNLWGTISFDNVTHLVIKEIIHVLPTDFLDICLVNTGKGVPFLSALELRHIQNNTIYRSPEGSLETWVRYDYGGDTTKPPIRYLDDIYDRIWYPILWSSTSVSTALTLDSLSENSYKPPPMVMRTAITPSSSNGSISISWNPPDRYAEYDIYMHFAQIEQSEKPRKIFIDLNNESWFGPVSLVYLSPWTMFNRASLKGLNLEFRIYTDDDDESSLPLINAMEFYRVRAFRKLPTQQNDVEAVTNIKEFYGLKKHWQGDPCLPHPEYIWDGLNCSYSGSDSPRITMLNLSSSGLAGEIAPVLANFSSLQYLDLSHNQLNGNIPEFISQMPSLRILNLTGNDLTGSVPQSLMEKVNQGTLSLSVDENPDLCLSSCSKDNNKKIIVAVVTPTLLSLVLLVAIVIFCKYRRIRPRDFLVGANEEGSLESKHKKFNYSEIKNITNNFKRVIGKGGSGIVYFGCLRDGTQVAVKILSPSSTHLKEFHTEVQLLMRIHHRNLASLVGYCDEGSNMALIYEYMANGNLQQHLSEETPIVLSWKQRLRIAVDAAQGLEYLHNGSKPPIIHRDMKTANILLSEKQQAKIADFGLSRIIASESVTHVSTGVAGTQGYLDPEYYTTYKLNEKSDVYSFGIVILELITGQPAIIRDTENIHIVKWVKSILAKGDIHKIVDPRLEGNFNVNSAWKVLETAMACVPSTAIQRLSMSEVLMDLKECLAMEYHEADERIMESNEVNISSSHSLCLSADLETDDVGPSPR